MSKGAKRRRGRIARRSENVGPTPETLAKLRHDPLLALIEHYDSQGDAGQGALAQAAGEIRAIYLAVCGTLMAGVGGAHGYGVAPGGRREMPAFLAWAHAQTYVPWATALDRKTRVAVIELVVERQSLDPDRWIAVGAALADYAERRRYRPAFEEE